MTTAAALAADLGVDEGDVDVLLELLGERAEQLPDELAGFLREVLDPHGDRPAGDVLAGGGRRAAPGVRARRPGPDGAVAHPCHPVVAKWVRSVAMAICWNEDKMRDAHDAVLDAVIKKAAGATDTEHIRRLAEAVALLQGTASSGSSGRSSSS